jgi:predicted branched-subunit amino acid permease
MPSLTEARAGAAAAAPMLLGVVPFGLVAGAAPVAHGFGGWSAVGLSTVVFAGASQLAIVDVLSHGGSALVAILAAWTINLRMVLYSASLAPYLGHESTRRRIGAAYLLTDQAYALSIARWARDDDVGRRLAFYLGAGALLCTSWVSATIAGAVVGGAVPDSVPLDFAVPLVFLVLLVPVLVDRPAVVAAVAGGVVAVVAAEAGAGPLSTILGAGAGIAAGALVDSRQEQAA